MVKEYNTGNKKETIVIKLGGSVIIDPLACKTFVRDLIGWANLGNKIVLVHGGGKEIDSLLQKLGYTPQFCDGLRVTDAPTMEAVQMVLAGKINKQIVLQIEEGGGKAIGLCGIDGGMIKAKQFSPSLGLVGKITAIDARLVHLSLQNGYIPVIASLAIAEDLIAENSLYNINADMAAAEIAIAIGADSLIYLTNMPGLLATPADSTTLIKNLTCKEARNMLATNKITGGMIPKIQCCIRAIEGSVAQVCIADGRTSFAVSDFFSDGKGKGTRIT